jgi:hypothetical protein
VVGVFVVIMAVPILALRTPKDRTKKPKGWWKFWRRRKSKHESLQRYWKRKRGQEKSKPFGHREVVSPSTFVAAPRKPTDP